MIELLALFGMMILQVVVPPIPAEALVIGAGKLYGTHTTALVAGSGLIIGSLIVYYVGIHIRHKYDTFFGKDKVKKVMARIEKYDTLILWVRLLPYNPSDIISYAAGIMRINARKFIAITTITSFVRCYTLASLGSMLQGLGSVIFVALLLLVSASVASVIVYKRK